LRQLWLGQIPFRPELSHLFAEIHEELLGAHWRHIAAGSIDRRSMLGNSWRNWKMNIRE